MDKLKLYEKLGARGFQKFVFKVERLKFNILRPYSNYAINFLDKRIDRKFDKFMKRRNSKFYSKLYGFSFSSKKR